MALKTNFLEAMTLKVIQLSNYIHMVKLTDATFNLQVISDTREIDVRSHGLQFAFRPLS